MLGLDDVVKLMAARIGGLVWDIAPFHGLEYASPSLAAACVYMASAPAEVFFSFEQNISDNTGERRRRCPYVHAHVLQACVYHDTVHASRYGN